MTTSSHENDVCDCYEYGANTFITKLVEFDKFLKAVVALGEYWLEIARLPAEYEDVHDKVVAKTAN